MEAVVLRSTTRTTAETFAKMKVASMIYWNIIGILAAENSLLVVGGVEKLLFEDYFSSLVTTKVSQNAYILFYIFWKWGRGLQMFI